MLILTFVLCAAGGLWSAAPAYVGVPHLLIAFGAGVLTALAVGLWRARVAARGLCRAQQEGSRRVLDAIGAVGRSAEWSMQQLQQGHTPRVPSPGGPDDPVGPAAQVSDPAVPGDIIVFSEVETALEELQADVVGRVIAAYEQSRLVVRHAMFRHIAQREHLLIMKLLAALAALQNQVKAASLLNEIFRIDNMAVRLRRMVDNLAILGGESASAVRQPVTVTLVLRGAIQAIEQYERARVVHGSHPPQLSLPGHVAPDVTNLVCELVENATRFSAPNTPVWVEARTVSADLVIEVTDRGESMPRDLLDQANTLLTSPHLVDVHKQLEDGRLGLLVVGMTAQRHRIHVELRRNPGGGTTAFITVPGDLLVWPEPEPEQEFAAPVPERRAPAARPLPAAVAAGQAPGQLPQRRGARQAAPSLGPTADGLPPLPVRPDAPSGTPQPQRSAAGPAAVTDSPGLFGDFRRGNQRALAEDIPSVPADSQ
ncbi:sensor histidine-kinase [Streptomyces zinciresistens K42]|uniref:histidine kinase n=2 Tax=Streptomyces TaxID=1883 RepID=G2GBB2_9ACTN|nr:sensor histidine-kinase [Streptomyces zinciresistens K42]